MLKQVREAFPKSAEHRVTLTCASQNERQLAEDAIHDGFSTIVCVGGDGTCGNVANAIIRARSDTRLAVIPAGTGNDFARTLGVESASPAKIAELVRSQSSTKMDVGRIDDVYFLNSCGFGFDVAVVEGLARARWIGKNFVYVYSALREIIGYKGIDLSVRSSSAEGAKNLHLLVVIANGSRFGGGLVIAPDATVTDGMLDAVMIRDANIGRRLRMFAAASSGAHLRFGEVTVERAQSFVLAFEKPPVFEADGELYAAQTREVTVDCLPRALNVVAGQNFS